MSLNLAKYLNPMVTNEISGLFHKYNERYLLDDSLSDLEAMLLTISLIEKTNNKSGVDYGESKNLFIHLGRKEDQFRKVVYDAKKINLIEQKNGTLSFQIKGIKKLEKALGQIEKTSVFLIKAGAHFTAIKLFEEFLQNEMAGDEILLFDSHISSSTLLPFIVLNQKLKTFKILTSNIYDLDKFEDYKKKFEKEVGCTIEVRKNPKIHDRWIICGSKVWALGTSIKDFGNKDTMINEVPGVKDSLRGLFELRWLEST